MALKGLVRHILGQQLPEQNAQAVDVGPRGQLAGGDGLQRPAAHPQRLSGESAATDECAPVSLTSPVVGYVDPCRR